MIKVRNPEYEALVREMIARNPFMKDLGFEIHTIEPGYTEGILEISEKHRQQNGYAHGGIISSLCDMAAGYASYAAVAADEYVFTAEIKVSYLRPARGSHLYTKGQVIKQGRSMNFCEAEVYSEDDEGQRYLVAKATTTMAIVHRDRRTDQHHAAQY